MARMSNHWRNLPLLGALTGVRCRFVARKPAEDLTPVQCRIRAAAALAGTDMTGLAKRLQAGGYGRGWTARTIGRIGARKNGSPATESALAAIAKVCDDLPYEFFTVDLWKIDEIAAAAEAAMAGDADTQPAIQDLVADMNSRLSELEAALAEAGFQWPKRKPGDDDSNPRPGQPGQP